MYNNDDDDNDDDDSSEIQIKINNIFLNLKESRLKLKYT